MNRQEAERALAAWASIERDELVRAAHAAGVSKNRIYTITGIARTTIDRILDPPMPDTQLDRLVAYLTRFIADWPRPHRYYLTSPIAATHSVEQLADAFVADVEWKTIKLGTFLNTPDGELLAAAVKALTPPPYQEDATLLIEALKLAGQKQHDAAVEAFVKGALVVAGVGAFAALVKGGN